ncbi:MAG: PLP-dependent aminotransferase family protein [Pseudolysinimonas sp.]|uniref:MocR-like transcription factor YczR n=1 Tax=Pseudolysinimonas sp. TaxID=2680009 RepID=UPI003C77E483
MASLSARALAALIVGWRDLANGPAYAALADRVRLLILDGRITLGTRLPAERELAAQLGLSRTTVSAAYADLRDSGYLDSLRGSGSVARLPSRGGIVPDVFVTDQLDFSKAVLPAHPAVADAAQRAVAALPSFLDESGFDPMGMRLARQAIADRYTARGLPTDADEVLITVGAQHAIVLLAHTLLSRGDRAIIESPSFPHAVEAIRAAGARVVAVPVTPDEGWDASALEQAFQRTSPVLAYLMPDNHNPTGATMPRAQREQVVALAAEQGTTLIIDETIGGLELDGQAAQPPFATLGRAVMLGSLGKSVWGGLRIGWIRADRELIQRVARNRFAASDLGTPILEQLILVDLLADLDRILDDRRAYLRASRDHLARRLAEDLPSWRMPTVAGGIAAWVNIGLPISSQLALAARNEGLVIAAGARFGVEGLFERFIRIPFTYPPDVIDRGVDALAAAWRSVARTPLAVTDGDYAQVV